MDHRLSELLKKYNAELISLPIDRDGYLIRGTHGKTSKIIVKSSLSDEQTEKVILHEIGHLKNDSDFKNYKHDYTTRLCCEHGANDYLIQEKVKQFVDLGNEADKANYVNLAASLGIDDFSKVKSELSKYLIK